jgi:hypothetical protein
MRNHLLAAIAAGCLLSAIPASAAIVYSNTPGRTAPSPFDGNTDAWTINFGFAVSDSFTLTSASSITGMDIWSWEAPGDTTTSVDYLIGTTFFDSTFASGTSTGLTDTFITTNGFGYSIDEISFSFSSPISLSAGTYYVTLQNAVNSNGNPTYWDENGGPSTAQENALGTIPSEAFDISGGAPTGTPEPGAMALVGCGMLLLGGGIRRKLRKS